MMLKVVAVCFDCFGAGLPGDDIVFAVHFWIEVFAAVSSALEIMGWLPPVVESEFPDWLKLSLL